MGLQVELQRIEDWKCEVVTGVERRAAGCSEEKERVQRRKEKERRREEEEGEERKRGSGREEDEGMGKF